MANVLSKPIGGTIACDSCVNGNSFMAYNEANLLRHKQDFCSGTRHLRTAPVANCVTGTFTCDTCINGNTFLALNEANLRRHKQEFCSGTKHERTIADGFVPKLKRQAASLSLIFCCPSCSRESRQSWVPLLPSVNSVCANDSNLQCDC